MADSGTALWGGRFDEPPEHAMWEFTVSHADRRLLEDDVAGSLAHVGMLGETGIIGGEQAAELRRGLEQIASEAASGAFGFLPGDEDVHTAVERRLGELIGPVAGLLHTGRSRNDQIALDIRLYLRRNAAARIDGLHGLAEVLAGQAEAAGETVVALYTHLQQAQAVPFAHHLLAHVWALLRSADRFASVVRRLDVSPLGAGAGGGSALPLRPDVVATSLGFSDVFDNSLDAVAGRDLVAEYAFCCAQAMADLSRLAEELVMWATSEFGWATYSDRYTTGSSALPHKKNPDVAELVRGKAAAVAGDVATLLGLQKGLPLAYNRDLQEDKEAVFHADDALRGSLAALTGMVATAEFHPPPPAAAVAALDLAEVLVERGVPFREAHRAVGALVGELERSGRAFTEATGADLAAAHDAFSAADLELLDPAVSVRRRISPGGGSHESVRAQLAALRSRLG